MNSDSLSHLIARDVRITGRRAGGRRYGCISLILLRAMGQMEDGEEPAMASIWRRMGLMNQICSEVGVKLAIYSVYSCQVTWRLGHDVIEKRFRKRDVGSVLPKTEIPFFRDCHLCSVALSK